MPKANSPHARFMAKVQRSLTGCWEWTAARNSHGYGVFYLDGQHVSAHRAVLLLAGVAVHPDLEVCHRCDNPQCVRMSHLFFGTHRDNMDDAAAKGRTVLPPHVQGDRHGAAKLTAALVRSIRHEVATTAPNLSEIARRHGVSPQAIWMAVNYKTWRHV